MKQAFRMDTDSLSISERLALIEEEYIAIESALKNGQTFDGQDVVRVRRLSQKPNSLRDLDIIRHPEVATTTQSKKWGMSHARVSQIKATGSARIYQFPKHQ
jgi:hypothetical protein